MAEIVKKRTLENPGRTGQNSAVIESEVFDASRKAREIIAEANEKANSILKESQAAAEQRLKDARAKGYSQGHQEGIQKYEEAIVHLNREYEDLLKSAEEQLVRLSVGIAQKIIKTEVQTNPAIIIEIVRKAIAPMNRKRGITLRINPKDKEILEGQRAQLVETLIHGGNILLIADENISRGGCLIETEHGTVDSRLETQMAILSRLLTGQNVSLNFSIEEDPAIIPSVAPSIGKDTSEAFLEQKAISYTSQDSIKEPVSTQPMEANLFQRGEAPQEEKPVCPETLPDGTDLGSYRQEEADKEEVRPAINPEEEENFVEEMNNLAESFKDGAGIDDILSSLDEIIDQDSDFDPEK